MAHSHPEGFRDCSDFIQSIVYLLDNELDEAEVAQVMTHLEECTPCLDRYDVQRRMKTVVARACQETAPDGLRQRIRLSISEVCIRVEPAD